jgi:hypothetical protein
VQKDCQQQDAVDEQAETRVQAGRQHFGGAVDAQVRERDQAGAGLEALQGVRPGRRGRRLFD